MCGSQPPGAGRCITAPGKVSGSSRLCRLPGMTETEPKFRVSRPAEKFEVTGRNLQLYRRLVGRTSLSGFIDNLSGAWGFFEGGQLRGHISTFTWLLLTERSHDAATESTQKPDNK
jgi:hypothetical protein